jgi:hypothetical protein
MFDFFEKPADNSVKPVDNSVKLAEFLGFQNFLFLSRLNFVSADFFQFLPNFTEFLKIRRIRHLPNFKEPLNFKTLDGWGAKLAKLLKDQQRSVEDSDVWTEIAIYVAPSEDEERIVGHEKVLVEGGELFITMLWALMIHTGITRQVENPIVADN